jgi:hypothetical protein
MQTALCSYCVGGQECEDVAGWTIKKVCKASTQGLLAKIEEVCTAAKVPVACWTDFKSSGPYWASGDDCIAPTVGVNLTNLPAACATGCPEPPEPENDFSGDFANETDPLAGAQSLNYVSCSASYPMPRDNDAQADFCACVTGGDGIVGVFCAYDCTCSVIDCVASDCQVQGYIVAIVTIGCLCYCASLCMAGCVIKTKRDRRNELHDDAMVMATLADSGNILGGSTNHLGLTASTGTFGMDQQSMMMQQQQQQQQMMMMQQQQQQQQPMAAGFGSQAYAPAPAHGGGVW